MSKSKKIGTLNRIRPQFLDDLGCTITDIDMESGVCEMEFDIAQRYCHSVDVIQGGFVTAILDAVTSHAVFALEQEVGTVSTLELKVTFYAASRMGKLKAVGRVDKMGRNIAFLSGDIFNSEGVRTASITSTAKIYRDNKKS